MDIQTMMKQAQEMQASMQRAQEELQRERAGAGGPGDRAVCE